MTEDKKLNAAESLVLIGRMIENTRNRMAGSAGLHLLTWGYVTVATTLAVWGWQAISTTHTGTTFGSCCR